MNERQRFQQALVQAARDLYQAGNAQTIVGPIGDGVYVAIGTAEGIKLMLPPDPFADAANDEVLPPAGN